MKKNHTTEYKMPTGLYSWFHAATKKQIKEFVNPPEGLVVNVGAGYKTINPVSDSNNIVALDYPEWDAENQPLPYEDGSVAGFIAFGFLEHINNPAEVLSEFQRCLKENRTVTIMVPYYNSQLQWQDLTHKKAYNEETWRCTFNNACFDKTVFPGESRSEWKFEVGINLIIGQEERNIFLLTQLIKRK